MEENKNIFGCCSGVFCPHCNTELVETVYVNDDFSDEESDNCYAYNFNECPNCGWDDK